MIFRSLGYQSETVFFNFDGKMEDRDQYTVLRTLTNPGFFWGNLLVFRETPKIGNCRNWISLFKKEFNDPAIRHVTLAWDDEQSEVGHVAEFLELGFELEAKAVLVAQSVHRPPRFNEDLTVKPLETSADWTAMVDLQVRCAHDHLPKEEWARFYRSQSARYQAMVDQGLGDWYGGYLGGRLVAGLGIFHSDGLGRFQIVCTDPDFRRQGLCGTLVYNTAIQALKVKGLRALVMCADPDYHAIQIYKSVGFEHCRTDYGVYWWDRSRQL